MLFLEMERLVRFQPRCELLLHIATVWVTELRCGEQLSEPPPRWKLHLSYDTWDSPVFSFRTEEVSWMRGGIFFFFSENKKEVQLTLTQALESSCKFPQLIQIASTQRL